MKTKSKPSIPEIVYRVSDLVASMLKEVNIGTNLAMAPGPSEGNGIKLRIVDLQAAETLSSFSAQ